MANSNHLGTLATAVVATLVAVGMLGLVEIRPAEATFPGKNGKIAFQRGRGSSYDIYKMNRNGKKIDNLTTNPADDEDPAFSPDGKKIAFTSDRDGNSDIYEMNVRGRRVVRLTTNPADDQDPAFSPDGKKVAFESDRDGDSDIYEENVRGTDLVQLTADPATTFGADWAVR